MADKICDFDYSKYYDEQKLLEKKKADFTLFFRGKKEYVGPNK